MNRIFKKLTTKPVWWWERKRPYPIRSRYNLLSPIAVTEGQKKFVVLTTPEALNDAMWAAWSWYRYLRPHGFQLQLAVDGEASASEILSVKSLFPGITIFNVNSLFVSICSELPSLGRFLGHHPLAKQVGLVLALSRQGPVLYSDHDVVAFNPPDELLENVEKDTPCYFLDDENGCHDPSMTAAVTAMGLEYIRRLNAGLLYVPRNALSISLVEKILADWNPVPFFYFTPQTVMSTLMRSANAQPLPEDRYAISNRRQFYWEKDLDYKAIAARHFTGTVRHVLYKYGMPILLQQCREKLSQERQANSNIVETLQEVHDDN